MNEFEQLAKKFHEQEEREKFYVKMMYDTLLRDIEQGRKKGCKKCGGVGFLPLMESKVHRINKEEGNIKYTSWSFRVRKCDCLKRNSQMYTTGDANEEEIKKVFG